MLYCFFVPYYIFQLLMPLRHFAIKGDVLWTEEGHRLSWRMMLRDRNGYVKFYVQDLETGKRFKFNLRKLLTKKQVRNMRTKPDMIWQTAQFIGEYYKKKGRKVAVYVDAKAGINTSKFTTAD